MNGSHADSIIQDKAASEGPAEINFWIEEEEDLTVHPPAKAEAQTADLAELSPTGAPEHSVYRPRSHGALSMSEPHHPRVEVAVALIMNRELEVLWVFNDLWGAFALPMTKIRQSAERKEEPRRAAARAAAEALGVPVCINAHWEALPELEVSDRELIQKIYAYDIYRADPHADFSQKLHIRKPHLWMTAQTAFSGKYEPLSQSCLDILSQLIRVGRLPEG